MAGLSGIVKKISDLVTGTPADDDCFVFGKSDLKKITLAKLKDALGITSLNSALTFVNAENNPDLFGKNFLLINASQEHGISQTTTYFSKPEEDSDWQNVPSTLQGRQWIGIRKVYRRNNAHVLVEIIEMYPVAGRLWYIFYNNELWTRWRSIMPTELS